MAAPAAAMRRLSITADDIRLSFVLNTPVARCKSYAKLIISMSHLKDAQIESGGAGLDHPKPPTNRVERSGLIRHMIAILAVSSIVLANMSRQVFNQTIPDMTPRPNKSLSLKAVMNNMPHGGSHLALDDVTTSVYSDTTTVQPIIEEDRYDWSPSEIGWIQGAFSISYAIFMIPAGRLSEVFGAKWVMFLCGFGSAICTLALPFLADQSYALAVASRFVLGWSSLFSSALLDLYICTSEL